MNPSNAAKITLGFGLALILLALGFFAASGEKTALIPVGVGLPIAIAGLIACKDNLRKHGVHVALVFALLGVLATGGMIPRIASGKASTLAAVEISAMGLICLAYLALGIVSFINARKARAGGE